MSGFCEVLQGVVGMYGIFTTSFVEEGGSCLHGISSGFASTWTAQVWNKEPKMSSTQHNGQLSYILLGPAVQLGL